MNEAFVSTATLFAMFQNSERFLCCSSSQMGREWESGRESVRESCRGGQLRRRGQPSFFIMTMRLCGKATILKHFRRSPIWFFFFLCVSNSGQCYIAFNMLFSYSRRTGAGVINLSAETRNFSRSTLARIHS